LRAGRADAMRRMTRFLMAMEEKLDIILDTFICPISGKVMTTPVLMEDGINYDESSLLGENRHYNSPDIKTWLANNVSPVTGLPWTKEPNPNRRLRDLIQDMATPTATPADPSTLLRIRLLVSLQWLVRFKLPISSESHDFRNALSKFTTAHPSALANINSFWPLRHDAPLCAQLGWECFKQLRAMVYTEFAMVARDIGYNTAGEVAYVATPYTRNQAWAHFVTAMSTYPMESKTTQLIHALRSAYPQTHIQDVSTQWTDFWGERRPMPPPQYNATGGGWEEYGRYGQIRSPPSSPYHFRNHFDLSRPHHN